MAGKLKNVFFTGHLYVIGGIETWLYQMGKAFPDKDITLVYKTGDAAQVSRIMESIRVQEFSGERISCEKAFFTLYGLGMLEYVDAAEKNLVVHGNYKELRWIPPELQEILEHIDHVYGVAQHVCDAFTELTGRECEVLYNPFTPVKPKKVLRLVTASRLSWEKGRDRMLLLADALDEKGIPFIWTVFTNSTDVIKRAGFVWRTPEYDISGHIAGADYLVQLSSSEGWPYSVLESLTLGTPVIVTDLPAFHEMGIINGKNGFILPLGMTDIPVEKICKGLPRVKGYTNKECGWGAILAPGKSTYNKEKTANAAVRVTRGYFDIEKKRDMKVGEDMVVSKERAAMLVGRGLASYICR